MWRIRELRSSFVYFYLFGQTSYIPLKGGHLNYLLGVSFFPKILHFLILFGAIITGVTQNSKWPNIFDFNSMVLIATVLLTFAADFLVLYSEFLSPFWSRTVCEMYAGVIQYTEHKFSITVPTNRFQNYFHLKIILFVLTETLSSALIIFIPNSFFKPIATYFLAILSIFKGMILLYIVLFIDLMQLLLFSLNFKLKSVTQNRLRRYSISIVFKQVKWIHYKLWKISKLINHRFGWIFVFSIIDYSTRFIVCLYYTFVLTQVTRKLSIWYFIRMSFWIWIFQYIAFLQQIDHKKYTR